MASLLQPLLILVCHAERRKQSMRTLSDMGILRSLTTSGLICFG